MSRFSKKLDIGLKHVHSICNPIRIHAEIRCGGFFEVKIIVNIKMGPDLMFTRPCGD